MKPDPMANVSPSLEEMAASLLTPSEAVYLAACSFRVTAANGPCLVRVLRPGPYTGLAQAARKALITAVITCHDQGAIRLETRHRARFFGLWNKTVLVSIQTDQAQERVYPFPDRMGLLISGKEPRRCACAR